MKKFLLIPLIYCLSACTSSTYDIIIINGQIADGTGKELFKSNIYIRNGKIIEIGNIENAIGKNILNAKGLVVSPGFIDMHTHSERKSLDFPSVENYLQQGVTTMVGGNCGSSPYPISNFIKETQSKGIGQNLNIIMQS